MLRAIASPFATASPNPPSANIQTFTVNGTWTKPATGNWVRVILIGAGGGGGSGASIISGTASSGGSGGGGGL
jgi:hypothetical protein